MEMIKTNQTKQKILSVITARFNYQHHYIAFLVSSVFQLSIYVQKSIYLISLLITNCW